MNSFHMTMVLKYVVEEMSSSQTDIQLEHINEPCSGRSVHSYTSPDYVYLRCNRTSSPNYPLGLLIGLLYTNLRASTVFQRAGAVLWTAGAAGAVFSQTPFYLSLELGFMVCFLHFMYICHARHYSTLEECALSEKKKKKYNRHVIYIVLVM